MAASSVTGVSGPGDSLGRYKPENSCGCGCGSTEDTGTTPIVKRGCYTTLNVNCPSSYKIGGNYGIKVC